MVLGNKDLRFGLRGSLGLDGSTGASFISGMFAFACSTGLLATLGCGAVRAFGDEATAGGLGKAVRGFGGELTAGAFGNVVRGFGGELVTGDLGKAVRGLTEGCGAETGGVCGVSVGLLAVLGRGLGEDLGVGFATSSLGADFGFGTPPGTVRLINGRAGLGVGPELGEVALVVSLRIALGLSFRL